MNEPTQNETDLVKGARTSTSDQILGNDFLKTVEEELAEIEKIKAGKKQSKT